MYLLPFDMGPHLVGLLRHPVSGLWCFDGTHACATFSARCPGHPGDSRWLAGGKMDAEQKRSGVKVNVTLPPKWNGWKRKKSRFGYGSNEFT